MMNFAERRSDACCGSDMVFQCFLFMLSDLWIMLFSLASVKESDCEMSKMVVVQDDWRAYNVCVNA